MKKLVQTTLLELITEVSDFERPKAYYFIQSELDSGILMDLLLRITFQTFTIPQNSLCQNGITKSLFAKATNEIISCQETIKKRLPSLLKVDINKKSPTLTIFIAPQAFWKDNDPNPHPVNELLGSIALPEMVILLEKTNNFSKRKSSIIADMIRHDVGKKSVTIPDLLKIINTASLISEKDLGLLGQSLKYILHQDELFFLLPKLLMTDKQEFFVLWSKTNKLFPIYFWTIFWGNYFSKLFVFKSNPDIYYLTNCQWLKSAANISSTKTFQALTPEKISSIVRQLFLIDWSVKNSSNSRSLDQIFLSI